MNRSKLTSLERCVLGALMRADGSCTAAAVASRIGVPVTDVRRVLEQLASIEPKLVCRQTEAGSRVESWTALESVIVAIDEQREWSPARQFALRPRRGLRTRKLVTLA